MNEGGAMDRVEQAVFGFQSGPGMRIVASSEPDPLIQTQWRNALERFIRLESQGLVPPPRQALSYFVLGDRQVAVLYRWTDDANTPGRNNSRALFGHPDVLTVPVALGLERWSGWRQFAPDGQRLPPVHPDDVVTVAQEVERALRRRAEQVSPNLEKILAQLIDRPRDPLSILGCPERDRTALMWAMKEVADEYLSRSGVRREWSFSTYEIDHKDGITGLPENVFLPGRPAGAAPATRSVVNLAADTPASQEAVQVAQQLVAGFLKGMPSYELANAAPRIRQPAQPEPVQVDDLSEEQRIYRSPQAPPHHSGYPDQQVEQLPPAAVGVRQGSGVGRREDHYGPNQPPPSAPQRPGPALSPDRPGPRAEFGQNPRTTSSPTHYPGQGGAKAVREEHNRHAHPIQRAQSEEELHTRLGQLDHVAADPESRGGYRSSLGVDGLNDIAALISILIPSGGTNRQGAYDRILSVVFGRDFVDLGTKDGLMFAANVVETCRSDEFVNRLIAGGSFTQPGCLDWLAGSIAHRYLVSSGLSVPQRPAARAPVQRAGNWSRWSPPPMSAKRRRRFAIAAAVAAVVLLGLVFLLGRLSIIGPAATGSSAQTQVPPVTTPPSGGGGAATLPAPIEWRGMPPPGQEVYLLLKPADKTGLYLIRGACKSIGVGESRTCTAKTAPTNDDGLFEAFIAYATPGAADQAASRGPIPENDAIFTVGAANGLDLQARISPATG